MSKKILHLPIKRKWFDEIATGKKKSEYREYKMHWVKRLLNSPNLAFKKFDEIHFRVGYNPSNPFLRAEHIDTALENIFNPETEYEGLNFCIHIGEILEIKNWKGPKE